MSTIVYTIYKTTNLINGKFYIGQHKTKNINDGYLGSGKYFTAAVKKYGPENFSTEILWICKTRQEADLAERIFVVLDLETSYNICRGGMGGGFDYINANKLGDKVAAGKKGRAAGDNEYRMQRLRESEANQRRIQKYRETGFFSHPKGLSPPYLQSDAARKKRKDTYKMIKHQSGSKNSCFGKIWITDGFINKRWKGEIPKGWKKGRVTRTQCKPTATYLINSILSFGC